MNCARCGRPESEHWSHGGFAICPTATFAPATGCPCGPTDDVCYRCGKFRDAHTHVYHGEDLCPDGKGSFGHPEVGRTAIGTAFDEVKRELRAQGYDANAADIVDRVLARLRGGT